MVWCLKGYRINAGSFSYLQWYSAGSGRQRGCSAQPQGLTIEQAIEKALLHSRSIRQAAYDVDRAEELRDNLSASWIMYRAAHRLCDRSTVYGW